MGSLAKSLQNLMKSTVAVAEPVSWPKEFKVAHLSKIKRVVKPWGFELWMADGSNGSYAFKIIFLKAGTRTSLQYHKQKAEHNCLLEGTIRLHYKHPTSNQISQQLLEAVHVIAIGPPGIHRIEAVTDVVLVEASTAHVDDIVRVADDYARPDGKILEEHETAKAI